MRSLIRKSDLKSPKLERIHMTKIEHRGLTTAQKKKIKKLRGFKCEVCKEKFKPAFLDIDHKRAIHKYSKGKIRDEVEAKINIGTKREKMSYDNSKNFQVLCKDCHQKKSKGEAGQRAKKKRMVNKDGLPMWMTG